MAVGKPLHIVAVVSSRSEVGEQLSSPGDAALIERFRPRLMVLKCPCGCGEELTINLDRKAGPAWRSYTRDGLITIFPSIWRDTGCESHFIIARNRIYLFDRSDDEFDDAPFDEFFGAVSTDSVLKLLSPTEWKSVEELADALAAGPWDVLETCRRLVFDRKAVRGRGPYRDSFRLVA